MGREPVKNKTFISEFTVYSILSSRDRLCFIATQLYPLYALKISKQTTLEIWC